MWPSQGQYILFSFYCFQRGKGGSLRGLQRQTIVRSLCRPFQKIESAVHHWPWLRRRSGALFLNFTPLSNLPLWNSCHAFWPSCYDYGANLATPASYVLSSAHRPSLSSRKGFSNSIWRVWVCSWVFMACQTRQGACSKKFWGERGGLTLQGVTETLGAGVALANVWLRLSFFGPEEARGLDVVLALLVKLICSIPGLLEGLSFL